MAKAHVKIEVQIGRERGRESECVSDSASMLDTFPTYWRRGAEQMQMENTKWQQQQFLERLLTAQQATH